MACFYEKHNNNQHMAKNDASAEEWTTILTDNFSSGLKGQFNSAFIMICSCKMKDTENVFPSRTNVVRL
jgi:hypothetical protein